MTHSDAPLFTDIAPGPGDGQAYWVHAQDGMRLRVGIWGRQSAGKGTILMFPGRTEYIEKYGHVASEMVLRGYSFAAIDWRGQGLADRLREDPRVGDVADFTDYQKDVGAFLRIAHAQNLPKPWFVLGHSMGGCIALRSLMEGLDPRAVAFSAPMWGIEIAPHLRPVAWTLTRVMPLIGRDGTFPPGRQPDPYVLTDPFENNMLTTDPDMFEMMREQITHHPDLALGGPSYRWLRLALNECLHLTRRPSPKVPCLAMLGTNERIVHSGRIHDRIGRWPGALLEILPGTEHEVLMERADVRNAMFDRIDAHFAAVS